MGFSTHGYVTEDKPLLSLGLCFLPQLSVLQGPHQLCHSLICRGLKTYQMSANVPDSGALTQFPLITVRMGNHP